MTKSFQLKRFVNYYWHVLIEAILGLSLISGLLLFKLSSLVAGTSPGEHKAMAASSSLRNILDNPLYAPHSILLWIAQKIAPGNIGWARLGSVLTALVSAILLFYIIRKWHSDRVAFITTILYVCSSWFLHVGRMAMPDIAHTCILGAIAFGIWSQKNRPLHWELPALLAAFLYLLYTPGMIWIVVFAFIIGRRRILSTIKRNRSGALLATFFVLLCILPLARAFVLKPELVHSYLGLPASLAMLSAVPKAIGLVFVRLFWHGPDNPQLWLGRLPLLDYCSAGLGLLGLYNYIKHINLDRSKIVLGGMIFAILLISCGVISLTILLPFIYLLVGGGIAYIFTNWLRVFPRNPFAFGLLIALLTITTAVVTYYNLSSYFVAWPQAPATKQVFSANE